MKTSFIKPKVIFYFVIAFSLVLSVFVPLAQINAAGANLIPTSPGSAPDYFCSWNIQGYYSNYINPQYERDAMNENNMFGTGQYQNWVSFYPRIRSDLYFVMDDSWDVDYTNYDYGADILNPVRFPTYASSGTEQDKLKNINTAVKNKGWRAIGGWICSNKAGAYSSMTDQDFYTQRLQWMNYAGWGYWKVDWGGNAYNATWRQNLTNWAHTYAPNLNVEHAMNWDCVPFADAFRTYDIEVITSIPVTLSRIASGIQYIAQPGAKAIINCEDEPVMGAALGCAIGIMRHPYVGNLPNGKQDYAFPPVQRDVKHCLDEVNRGVLWHRVAPPFKVDGNTIIDSTTLQDSWYFLANEGWATGANTWSYNSAPTRITRGGLPLPTVNVASGEKPFVIAGRNPNGVVSIATLPRTICYSTTDRRFWTPLADVTLNVGPLTGLIGIFGRYNTLTLTFDSSMSGRTILAQDILDTQSTDITSQVTINGNSITLSGSLINQIGLAKATSGDKSDPGMVISISGAVSNLALNKTASADISQSGYDAAKGNDGDSITRWCASDGNTGHWWKVDLGSNVNIGSTQVTWEFNNAYKYKIDVSTDNSTWTTKVDKSGNTTAAQTMYDSFSATARYVRITVTGLPSGCWASFYDFKVYSANGSSPTPTPTPTPTPAPGVNLALNKTVTVSSIENTGTPGSAAVDGNAGTRWSSAASDPQWIYVDLGGTYSINKVVLNWESAYGKSYIIQVSSDASAWTTVWSTTTGAAGITTATFTATNAKFVRVYGTVRGTQWGYSLWEFEVYGAGSTVNTWNDNNANISYTGSWGAGSDANCYNGDYHSSNVLNDSCVISFSGTQAKLYGSKNDWCGKADIYVDNVKKATIDNYSATKLYQQLFYDTGTLSSGNHTLKIVVLHQTTGVESYIDVDKVEVTN